MSDPGFDFDSEKSGEQIPEIGFLPDEKLDWWLYATRDQEVVFEQDLPEAYPKDREPPD